MYKYVKRFSWLLICITCGYRAMAQQEISPEEYIAAYKRLAEEEMLRTGVPAAISLAQGILESDSGNGWLVQHSNNHFGLKCKSSWTGATVFHDDDSPGECFRKYDNAEASWRDHSDFLKNSQRYASLFRIAPGDYKAWAEGLKKAGYATSNSYTKKLVEIIERYHLDQYTAEALNLEKQGSANAFAKMLNKKVETDEEERRLAEAKPVKKKTPVVTVSKYPEGIFRINGKKVVYVDESHSLITLAEKYDVKLRRLLRFNELDKDTTVSAALLYLQKKGKQGAHAVHVLHTGESMHSVAQVEGIRLKWLYKRNRMKQGEQPPIGSQLVLQGYVPKHAAAKPSWQTSLSRLLDARQKENDSIQVEAADMKKSKPGEPSYPAKARQEASQEKILLSKENRSEDSNTNQVAGDTYHIVAAKETLYGISRQYGVTIEQLQSWNHLTGSNIRTGQRLIVKPGK